MIGRFPLFTDACVSGQVVDAPVERGLDVVRAVDLSGGRAKAAALFEAAAREGRAFVTNDGPIERIAIQWLREGRPFRLIYWSKTHDEQWTVGEIVEAFEQSAREDDPFFYPIVHL